MPLAAPIPAERLTISPKEITVSAGAWVGAEGELTILTEEDGIEDEDKVEVEGEVEDEVEDEVEVEGAGPQFCNTEAAMDSSQSAGESLKRWQASLRLVASRNAHFS